MSLGDLLSVQSAMNFRLATSYTYGDWEDSVTIEVKIIRFESVEQNFQTIYPGLQLPHIHKKDNPSAKIE